MDKMKIFLRLSAVLAMAVSVLSCKTEKLENAELHVTDDAGVELSGLSFGMEGGESVVEIVTGADWEISVPEDATWLSVLPKNGTGNAEVSISASVNESDDARESEITVSADAGRLVVKLAVSQSGLSALGEGLMMDVVFNEDGSAKDASPLNNNVATIAGNDLLIYHNNAWGGYVPRFNHQCGETVTSGFYKAYYNTSKAFQNGMNDGFSLETVFMLNKYPEGSGEVRIFSSVESGGTGIFVTASDIGSRIAFEINLSQTGSMYLVSNVSPELGKYYHVVCTWDKEAARAKIYINGSSGGELSAKGDYKQPSSTSLQWFGIGVDTGYQGQCALNGDVLAARVYDDVLGAEEVEALWKKADREYGSLTVDNVLMFTDCDVLPGTDYMILGQGYLDGDIVTIVSSSDASYKKTCEGKASAGNITITLPSDLVTGTYKFFLTRGNDEIPLGVARLVVSDHEFVPKVPEVVAHRGYHNVSGVAENSVASLKGAMALGVYGCEIDIWITLDGRLVVHHDGTMSGKTFQNSEYSEIKDFKLSNGETLPTLEDMLEILSESSHTKLIIEVKEHSTAQRNADAAEEAMRLVSEAGLEDMVEYISFDLDVCRKIAAAVPDVTVGYLTGDKRPAELLSYGIRCIDYPFQTLNTDRSLISEAGKNGMVVNIWTVDSDYDLMTAISMGVDLITTDNPDRLMEIRGLME